MRSLTRLKRNALRLYSIVLIYLISIALLGCSSGGSSSGGQITPNDPNHAFTLEEIPPAVVPSEQTMTRQGASVFAMYLLRLYSWEAEVSSVNHDGSNHYAFLPYNTLPSTPVGDIVCYSSTPQLVRAAPEFGDDFKAISYDNCVTPFRDGEKSYFNGDVAFRYIKYGVSDSAGGLLEVRYQNLHTQFADDELTKYGKRRAERFNGSFQVESDGQEWTFSANLTLLNNIIGEINFKSVLIKRDAHGYITHATGTIEASGHGIFQISDSDGKLIIGEQPGNHLQIKPNPIGASVDFHTTEEVYGQYISYDWIDEYDVRRNEIPIQFEFPLGFDRQGVNDDGLNSANDLFFLQGEDVTINIQKYYKLFDESLIDFSLELIAIETFTRIYGDKNDTLDPNIPISELPDGSAPSISLEELGAGRFSLIVDNLPGSKTALVFRPSIKGNSSELPQPATFRVFLIGDFDRDGIFDHQDEDTDNDGIKNSEDDLPFDASSAKDADYDGIGDFIDNDSDGDTIADEEDYAPLDPNCHLPFSAAQGLCFNPIYNFQLVGATSNGIVLLKSSNTEMVIFRYDVIRGVFYPPILLDDVGYAWQISTNTKENKLYLYTGGGHLYTALNSFAEVELVPILNALHPIDATSRTAIAEIGDYIYVEAPRDQNNGLKRSYLYDLDGTERASMESLDTGYLGLCASELLSRQMCPPFNQITLPADDVMRGSFYTPNGIWHSPNFDYWASSVQVFGAGGELVHQFDYADSVVGWTTDGLIANDRGIVGVWDLEKSEFVISMTFEQEKGNQFLLIKDDLYLLQWGLNEQLSTRKIQWSD